MKPDSTWRASWLKSTCFIPRKELPSVVGNEMSISELASKFRLELPMFWTSLKSERELIWSVFQ